LRDWTNTSELEAIGTRIGAALKRVFPEPSGISVVFAACGAGGLLAEVPPEFERVLGFDLTFPVLRAARHLLDGGSFDMVLPRAINQTGHVTLRRREGRPSSRHIELVAMDALDTGFADGSVACVVTSFLIDLFPEPRKLANEIHRVLCNDGIWINYGPSGPLQAFFRFDQTESAAFLDAAGFTVIGAEAYRTTYLDLSRHCPSWSFQNHICYLTTARKTGAAREDLVRRMPNAAEIPQIVPQHFPGAILSYRHNLEGQKLEAGQTPVAILRHDGVPGRTMSLEITGGSARVMMLVDGKRTVDQIADLFNDDATPLPKDEIFGAFLYYFEQGLLSWRLDENRLRDNS
jgi:SAM-dependent methyltransferase